MEVNQQDYSHDEIVYDDRFRISIFNIFDYMVPKDNYVLSQYMDKSGYIGRYDIVQIKHKRKLPDKYKIKIYLPNSRTHYYWPFIVPYQFDGLESVYKAHKRLPNSIKNVLLLSYDMSYISSYDIIKRGIGLDKVQKSIDMLHQLGIYKNNKSIITDKNDIWELYNNIKKIKQY